MGRRVAAHWRVAVAAVVVAGALIRLPCATVDQHVIADPALLLSWSRRLVEDGLPAVLDAIRENRDVVYPPLAMLGILFSGLVMLWTGGAAALADSTAVVAIKAWPILADTVLAACMARLLRAAGPWASVGGAAAIALNPAFWYLASLWGQIDSVMVLLMVVSVAAMGRRRSAFAWAGWAGAALWKLQALPLAPVLVVHSLRTSGMRGTVRGVAVAVGLGVACTALLLLTSGGSDLYPGRLLHQTDALDVTAFNAWYLVTSDALGAAAMGEALHGAAGAVVGYGLAGMAVLVVMAALWRWPGSVSIALCAAMASLAAFLFLPGMRERYLLPAIPMLALVAGGWPAGPPDRGAVVAFVVVTATQFLNLVSVGSFAPDLWTNVFAASSIGPLVRPLAALGAVAAVANLAVLGWGLRRLVRQAWPAGGPPASRPGPGSGDLAHVG
jgi:hypothetical protein